MADDERGCDQLQVRLYVVGVTEPTPESTLADVLAAIQAQGRTLTTLAAKMSVMESTQDAMQTALAEHRGETKARIESVGRDLGKLRDALDSRTEAIRADIAGVKTDTSFVESYVNDMHEAMRRHIADPNAHPDAA